MSADLNSIRQDWDGQLPSFAWPGGYPLYYLDSRNKSMCVKCARSADMNPEMEVVDLPVVCGINWENAFLFCDAPFAADDCTDRIESAYADDCYDRTCEGSDCVHADQHGCAERDQS